MKSILTSTFLAAFLFLAADSALGEDPTEPIAVGGFFVILTKHGLSKALGDSSWMLRQLRALGVIDRWMPKQLRELGVRNPKLSPMYSKPSNDPKELAIWLQCGLRFEYFFTFDDPRIIELCDKIVADSEISYCFPNVVISEDCMEPSSPR